MAGLSTPTLPDVPPFDCCIFYGSNFFAQQRKKENTPEKPLDRPEDFPVGPLKQAGGLPLGAPIDDILVLVPKQQLLHWHTENIEEHGSHYAPLFRYISRLWCPPAAAAYAVRLTGASGIPILFNCRVPLKSGGNKVRITIPL